jgi:tetratricopeptide (TPR) repeat protein
MFHEARVKRDPEGAIGWAFLSNAYLARSREEDSYADAIKAEQAARKSLALRTLGNLGAPVRLVNSLLQQHRFLDALAEDEKALKLWGAEPTLTQLHADILIEVGRYDEASKDLISNPEAFNTPGGKAVRAHLDTIQGKLNQALALLKSAHADIVNNSVVESDAISWFEEKMGETHYLMGQLKEA